MVKWRDSYEKDLSCLLEKVCRDYGFCDASRFDDRLFQKPSVTAGEFADFVLISEGLDPAREDQWRDVLGLAFTRWFRRERTAPGDYSPSSGDVG